MGAPERMLQTLEPDLIDVTLSCDTVQYSNNDLLADTQAISGAVFKDGGSAILKSLMVIDKDDNARAIDILIAEDTTSFGTENSAFAPADATTAKIQAVIEVGTADYSDFANAQVATKADLNVVVKASAGSNDLGIAAVYRDATGDTYTASGLVVRVGLVSN